MTEGCGHRVYINQKPSNQATVSRVCVLAESERQYKMSALEWSNYPGKATSEVSAVYPL